MKVYGDGSSNAIQDFELVLELPFGSRLSRVEAATLVVATTVPPVLMLTVTVPVRGLVPVKYANFTKTASTTIPLAVTLPEIVPPEAFEIPICDDS